MDAEIFIPFRKGGCSLQIINIWYIVFIIFYGAGLLGLALSVIMRMELASCGDLILNSNINFIILCYCTCSYNDFFFRYACFNGGFGNGSYRSY
jgi:hypothetical protein